MTEFIIKIDMVYFLGILGSLILIAWYGGHRLGGIETSIRWIKEEVVKIWEAIKSLESKVAGVEGKESPVNPTELGKKYLEESGLQTIIDGERKEFLLNLLRTQLPEIHADYDAQESARRVITSLRDDPLMAPVKDYAFQNGLDVDIILRLGGLLLRDNFLGWQHRVAPTPQKSDTEIQTIE